MSKTENKKGLTREEVQEAIRKAERPFVTQKVLLYSPVEKKYLLLLNADTNLWELPGGLVDKDEDLMNALSREVKEEVGEVKYGHPELLTTLLTHYSFEGEKHPVLMLGYLAEYQEGEIVLSHEHKEFTWKSLEEIQAMEDKDIQPAVKKIIEARLKAKTGDEYLNDLKRVQADFENYKKRQAAEAKEFSTHLAKSLVSDLIPVLTNLQAASDHVPADAKESPWVMGITYIEKQFEDALKNYGVVPIEAKPGDTFNPLEHEAVDQKTEAGKDSEHKIEKVVQKGYKMGERVIKAARVIVS